MLCFDSQLVGNIILNCLIAAVEIGWNHNRHNIDYRTLISLIMLYHCFSCSNPGFVWPYSPFDSSAIGYSFLLNLYYFFIYFISLFCLSNPISYCISPACFFCIWVSLPELIITYHIISSLSRWNITWLLYIYIYHHHYTYLQNPPAKFMPLC